MMFENSGRLVRFAAFIVFAIVLMGVLSQVFASVLPAQTSGVVAFFVSLFVADFAIGR